MKGMNMRRLTILMMAAVPVTLMSMGCDVTSRQLQDFGFSTAVRVFVQTAVSVFEASVLQGATG